MTPRERVRKALNHQEPDRVPLDLGGYQTGIMVQAYDGLKALLRHQVGDLSETSILEPMQQLAVVDEQVLKALHVDTRYVFPRSAEPWQEEQMADGSLTYSSEFGQKLVKKPHWHYYEFLNYPLEHANIDDIVQYQGWPDPDDTRRLQCLKEDLEHLYYHTDYALVSVLGSATLEQAWYLRGLERFMMDIVENPAFVERLLDRLLELEVKLYGNFLDVAGPYLEAVQLYGDLSGQFGPITSPRFIREVVLPRDKVLIETIKSKTDAKVIWHSCGAVYEFVEYLISIGIDVLNPIQVSAQGMENTKRLKTEFGNRLSFWGGIDTQRILPFGAVGEVEDEVKRRIDDLAQDGGYVVAAVHNIQDEVPPENIVAMFETAFRYGRYER